MNNSRKVLYGAVAYSVILGVIYVALSLLGLLTRWCSLDAKSSPLIYLLYFLYFRVERCEANIQWEKLNINSDVLLDMPNETQAAQRTFIFLITYLTLHSALIVVSLCAFCAIKASCVGRKYFAAFFVPWMVVMIAIVIVDIVATVYYIVDTVQIMKIDGLIQLLEIVNIETVRDSFDKIGFLVRLLPSIIMILAASKVFLFLICNIIWAVTITKSGWSFSKQKNELKTNYQSAIVANDNPAFEDENEQKFQPQQQAQTESEDNQTSIHEVQANNNNNNNNKKSNGTKTEERYHDTSRSIDFVYPHQIYAKSKKQKKKSVDEEEINFRIQRPTLAVQSQYRQSSERSSASPSYQNQIVDSEIENRLSRFKEINGNAIRKSASENQYASIVLKPQHHRPSPPPKPIPNNKFFLQATGHEEPIQFRTESRLSDARVERTSSNLKAPDELRSQLPWSYFKSGENLPRHALIHSDDEFPEVPIPDYNLSPKNVRGRNQHESSEQSWNYQRY